MAQRRISLGKLADQPIRKPRRAPHFPILDHAHHVGQRPQLDVGQRPQLARYAAAIAGVTRKLWWLRTKL
jgi:hypothetical protein